ncbi:NADH-quinone oxidoreductase subunit G [Halorhodospira abdelmalekii]|uniref:NADH-quinone oxidoreductase subunit NuoG n=1 Tax=Halorhodospira abdelmalekii TaxID=421629 RepID=UPI0019082855|nr:NADH-quinone oxidoreductase subunit NuoG [Halorhodospira abdelmalekii]MBK1734248.1 NADH-quinone oxidoreductase subunit G [Halorhodospira abdelmalekii]
MSQEKVTIEIDGRTIGARAGEPLIEAADRAGIYIPRFCYHKHLSVVASCRMCLVEVERAPKPLPACATQVADGMKVATRSAGALDAQRGVMEFLLINHPLDCPICDQGGECELQDQALGYGRGVSRFVEGKRAVADEDLGPLVATEMTRCIHCTRCVRFLEEIAGDQELGGMHRGEQLRISTYTGEPLRSELSSNIIDLCPVGALTNKPFRFRARAWELLSFPMVSVHDGVGSHLSVHTYQGRIQRVVPRECSTINETWIADRDRYAIEGLAAPDRLREPLVKRYGEWHTAGWEEALSAAVAGVRRVLEGHGAAGIGALLAPHATLEELYLGGRVVRALGSANVDHRLREGDVSDQEQAPPFPYLGGTIAELEQADAVLLIGSYPRHEQPLIQHRLRKAARAGAQIMALGLRRFAWNFELAEEHAVAPQHLVSELAAVAQALGERKQRKLPQALRGLPGGSVSEPARAMAKRLLAGERAVVLLGNQALSHPQAATLRALAALIGEWSGGRFGVLAAAANSAGGWLAGALPHREVAGRPSAEQGLAADAMVRAQLPCYLLHDVEPEHDLWDPAAADAALRQAEHVVAVSSFASERLREVADVLLPLGAFGETAGTYVNTEGRWQSVRGVAQSYAEARPGWRIWCALAQLLELEGFAYPDIAAVHAEIAGACRDVQPSSRYPAELRSSGATSADGGSSSAPGRASGQGSGVTLALAGAVPIYAGDALVRRSEPLQQSPLAARLEAVVAPETAQQLGISHAETDEATVRVRVQAAAAEALELPLVVSSTIPAGTVWIPAGLAERAQLGPPFGTVTIEAL